MKDRLGGWDRMFCKKEFRISCIPHQKIFEIITEHHKIKYRSLSFTPLVIPFDF